MIQSTLGNVEERNKKEIIRERRIKSIQYSVLNARKESRDINEEQLIGLICERYQIAYRTAKEYFKMAMYRVDNPDFEKQIKEWKDFEEHMLENEPEEKYAAERRREKDGA